MKRTWFFEVLSKLQRLWASLLASIQFYTILPLPQTWPLNFGRIARWAPWVGVLIGGILAGIAAIASHWGWPPLLRSAALVAIWLWLTGGLHLDGAIDSADGLAVTDRTRRLSVMADSVVGAFGVMAAVILLLLKTSALSELAHDLGWILAGAAAWGRWGQVLAIACYPYLKPKGKGAFHRQYLRSPIDIFWGLAAPLALHLIWSLIEPLAWQSILALIGGGGAIAMGTGYWFHRQLGGHTGDTYGAVVEWTEALYLCWAAILMSS